MARYLTQQWLDERRRLWSQLPTRPGASARIQYVLHDAPGEIASQYWVDYLDGHIESSQLGVLDDPQVTLSFTYQDGIAMERGDLDPNVAFADTRIRFTGNMRTLMGMFPILWPSPTSHIATATRYRDVQAQIREITEF